MDKRSCRPAASSGARAASRAGSPRSRGGRSTRCRASPSTRRPSPTTSRRRCAGWRDELAVPLSSVLLAAHAKVLAALSGEREVVTGYVAGTGGRPLPCRLTTEPGSWRALLLDAHRAESELLAHQDFPVDDLGASWAWPGRRSRPCSTRPAATAATSPRAPCCGSASRDRDGRLALRLRYRTDVLDADCAARIAGYHLTALALIAADPDAEHGRQSLLSAEELALPARRAGRAAPGAAGPPVPRAVRAAGAAAPGRRRGRARRPAVDLRELNARANRLARALLARGLRREGVVAVVTERNLDWMAAVLAVFKAGGVYLPIEPHFPADRIATTLARAECALVLTEPGSTTTLDQALDALPGVQTLLVEAAYAEDHADDDLGVAVAPDQLAYIYFTSGSTGEPKGAMCEHAGMLNHLYAKIDDLEIGEGQVVAQTAPQCFDISLWQLVSALLVGGRTLIVEQEVILDVAAVRRHDRRRPGRACCRSCRPTSRSCCPTWSSTPASCPTCGACRSPARR